MNVLLFASSTSLFDFAIPRHHLIQDLIGQLVELSVQFFQHVAYVLIRYEPVRFRAFHDGIQDTAASRSSWTSREQPVASSDRKASDRSFHQRVGHRYAPVFQVDFQSFFIVDQVLQRLLFFLRFPSLSGHPVFAHTKTCSTSGLSRSTLSFSRSFFVRF